MPVTVVTLQPQTVTLTRELPGRTSAFLVAEVRPQVDGIVKQRLYAEGSVVKAGQPLYQLDDAVYRADYASAEAALARARATLNTARLNAKRSAELVAINAVSPQEN
jgi:membrane fusion protein (multidrug efflux system)